MVRDILIPPDESYKPARDLRAALSYGTTLVLRFFMALFSLSLGATIWIGESSLMAPVGRSVFFREMPNEVWVVALMLCGGLMMWRVLMRMPRPLWAWASNLLTCTVWSTIMAGRIEVMGIRGLLGNAFIIWLISAVIVLRTEATVRDQETA